MRTGLIDAAKKILDKAELVGTAEDKNKKITTRERNERGR